MNNNINIMKKIFRKLLIFTFLLTVFPSCDNMSFLATVPYSYTSPDNYYRTLSEFENALTGCYDAINTSYVGSSFVEDGNYAWGLQMMLNGGTDELILVNSVSLADYTVFGDASYNTTSTPISDFWITYYAGIMRCNYVIEKANQISLSTSDQSRLAQIVGEAHFLRAFYYYHLAELFGGVPLHTSIGESAGSRQSLEVVYNKLIIPDLQFAYNSLPNRPTITARANKWSAAGYLGVVYNYLSSCKRYNVGLPNDSLNSFSWVNADTMSLKAKTILKTIIDNSNYKLTAKYNYLFRETTKSYQQEECLFTAENTLKTSDSYPLAVYQFAPGSSAKGGSYGIYRSPIELYPIYESTGKIDIRRSYNIVQAYTSTTETIEGISYYVPGVSNGATSSLNYTGKFRCENPDDGVRSLPRGRSGVSLPLLRYADILLQYAEALYFTGDEATARTYFTQVRSRIVATGQDVASLNTTYYKADFVQELLDERKRELCFESKRRIDLIRFGKLTSTIAALSTTVAHNVTAKTLQANWTDYKIWFPIPLREMDLNHQLIQNSGY